MPLEWTHDWAKCPKQATTCSGDTTCLEFPTPADRIAMARAAYAEYSEADDTPLEDFVLDVEMLARAEGLEQKVWVVMWHPGQRSPTKVGITWQGSGLQSLPRGMRASPAPTSGLTSQWAR